MSTSLAATRLDQPFELLADNCLGQLRHDFPGDFLDKLARGRLQGGAQQLFLRGRGHRLSRLNVLYGFLLLFCVVMTYNTVNSVIVSFTGQKDSVPIGVEPILFGLITTGWDFLFLGIKRTVRRIVDDAKAAHQTGAR